MRRFIGGIFHSIFAFSLSLMRLVILIVSLLVMASCSGSKKVVQTETQPPPPPPVETKMEPVAPKEETKTVEEKAPAIPFVLENIYFDYDQYDLTPEALQALAVNASVLKAYPEAKIIIEGHCDERGTVEYNLALGEKRASAAREYLTSLGVNPAQISTISYGKERPVDSRHTEEAWSKNRRAEFVRR